jgi:hypothetical protein
MPIRATVNMVIVKRVYAEKTADPDRFAKRQEVLLKLVELIRVGVVILETSTDPR